METQVKPLVRRAGVSRYATRATGGMVRMVLFMAIGIALGACTGDSGQQIVGVEASGLLGKTGGHSGGGGGPAGAISISPDTLNLQAGASQTFTVTVLDKKGNVVSGTPVTWTSSAARVATVDANGTVTGVSAGLAAIVAAAGKTADSAVVSVWDTTTAAASSTPARITLSPDSLSLVTGAATTVSATVLDSAGSIVSGQRVVWVTHDSSVARVDSTGLVTAVGVGTTDIIATDQIVAGSLPVAVQAPTYPRLGIATTSPLADGLDGTAYSQTLSVTGGLAPYAWSLNGQPSWLSIDRNTGKLNGNAKAGTYTFNVYVASADSQSISGTFSLTVDTLTGSSPTIISLSRDAGSTAGGATVLVNGTGFVASQTPVVLFGGTAAATTFVNSTQLSAVTPSHAAGQVAVKVTQGAASYTLTGVLPNGGGAFEYLPAPTTTYVSENFEGGTLGALTSYSGKGSVSVQTVSSAVSGTHAAVCTAPAGGAGSAALFFSYTPKQPPLATNGLYQRWYVRLDQETINALSGNTGGSDQMKILLDRAETNPPSWLAMTWGYSILGDTEIKLFRDFSGGLAPIVGGRANGHTGFKFNQHVGEWIEIETHFVRSGGVGRARLWINGKLIADDTDPGYGTDDASRQMLWDLGISYYQDNVLGHTMTMQVDNVKAANGFIDPGR